ncbi:hypothetical protein GGI07_003666 [Coemansia sp. Benny D115]|nr:hypothetical protein GGI07_003666 [Coemansia sp. Benny D115]
MPELPEVERARRMLHSRCVNKEITWARSVDDAMVFPEKRGHSLAIQLKGRKVVDTGRRGKLFWLVLSGGMNLFVHFGMTGDVLISDEPHNRYRKVDVDLGGAWPPLYTKLEMEFGRDLAVAFVDPRRLGKIRSFEGNATEHPMVKKLGFDPILDPPGQEMPNGQVIDFVTVGGRTSAIVPDVQILTPTEITPDETEEEDEEALSDTETKYIPEPAPVRRRFTFKRRAEQTTKES